MSARRRFGQHFLEPPWTTKVLAALQPGAGDTFLEIGPGRGALTLPLAARAGQVIAVEIDRDLSAALARVAPANVRIISGDILDVDLTAILPADVPAVRVAGNLPYYVSSPILGRLFTLHEREPRLTDATLMVQREVAERLTAEPGTRDYGALTVAARRHAHVALLLALPPGAFRPVPKVHSSLVRLRFRRGGDRTEVPAVFDALVRTVFNQRRKRLSNALRPLADALGRPSAAGVLADAGIDPARRPETLTLEEFVRLAVVLDSPGRTPPGGP